MISLNIYKIGIGRLIGIQRQRHKVGAGRFGKSARREYPIKMLGKSAG